MSKECYKCKEILPFDNFQKEFGYTDGYRNSCKKCKKLSYNFVYTDDQLLTCNICKEIKKYEEMSLKGKYKPSYCKVCINIKQKIKKAKINIISEVKTIEYFKLLRRERDRRYYNNRYKNNPLYRIVHNLRHRVWEAVKNKCGNTMELTGCSKDDLMKHLESQFTEGMTFENYGKWHIDHIRPCTSFNLSDPEEQKKCFHWTNLQPLWAADNIRKSNKYLRDIEENLTNLKI
jgi:hypothetical protein